MSRAQFLLIFSEEQVRSSSSLESNFTPWGKSKQSEGVYLPLLKEVASGKRPTGRVSFSFDKFFLLEVERCDTCLYP